MDMMRRSDTIKPLIAGALLASGIHAQAGEDSTALGIGVKDKGSSEILISKDKGSSEILISKSWLLVHP